MGEIADALRQADRTRSEDGSSQPAPAPSPEVARELRSAPTPSSIRDLPARVSERTSDRASPASLGAATARPQEEPPSPTIQPFAGLGRFEGESQLEPARVTLRDPQGPPTQQFRRLAFRVRELLEDRRIRSLVVTSAQPFDGKSTTACNLAVQLARLDQAARVCLVDLDLHRASLARYLGADFDLSIEHVLRGDCTISEALIDTDLAGLALLLQNMRAEEDPASVLAQPSLKATIRELESRFDVVVIDTPPLLPTPDAQVILRHSGAAILVARSGATRARDLEAATALIPPEKRLGSILNFSKPKRGRENSEYHRPQNDDDSSREAPKEAPEPVADAE